MCDNAITDVKSLCLAAGLNNLARGIRYLNHWETHLRVVEAVDNQFVPIVEGDGRNSNQHIRRTGLRNGAFGQLQILPAKTVKFPCFHIPLLLFSFVRV
jgi:hypothetical protein